MLCAVAQTEGWTTDPNTGLCQVGSCLCILHVLIGPLLFWICERAGVTSGACGVCAAQRGCCLQVKPLKVPDQERAHPKHLESLTEYLMHLERA